ncbi:MAG: nitronate monooxygenase, partial [Ginsengibacter sp.]
CRRGSGRKQIVVSNEASSHIHFKNAVLDAKEGDTILTLKQLTPVRIIKNEFFTKIQQAEQSCASKDELQKLLGNGRAKKGIFEGDLQEGELEIGQVSAGINKIQPAADILNELYASFMNSLKHPLK